jgi:hypothetical protein
MKPGFVQAPGFGIQYSRNYVYTPSGQKGGSATGDLRVGVAAGDEYPANTGGQDGLGARRGAPLVIAGLQGYIKVGASGGLTRVK